MTLAKTVKEALNRPSLTTFVEQPDDLDYEKLYDDYIIEIIETSPFSMLSLIYDPIAFDKLKVAKCPNIIGDTSKPSAMTCRFIFLNPNGKNREVAESYISDLCKSLMAENNLLLSDYSSFDCAPPEFLSELNKVYSDGKVFFCGRRECFNQPFLEYIKNERTLEDTAAEIERKTNINMEE